MPVNNCDAQPKKLADVEFADFEAYVRIQESGVVGKTIVGLIRLNTMSKFRFCTEPRARKRFKLTGLNSELKEGIRAFKKRVAAHVQECLAKA